MEGVVCPGCGETVSLAGLKAGDRIDCPNCANLILRVKKRGEEHYLEEIPKGPTKKILYKVLKKYYLRKFSN